MNLQRGMILCCTGFPDHTIRVTRVAKDGTWADVFVYDNLSLTSWSKRMPLPLTDAWTVGS